CRFPSRKIRSKSSAVAIPEPVHSRSTLLTWCAWICPAILSNSTSILPPPIKVRSRSDLLCFPAPSLEQDRAGSRDCPFRNHDGEESSVRLHAHGNRQPVGQWNFQQPEAEEIHDGGRHRVPGAVKGL